MIKSSLKAIYKQTVLENPALTLLVTVLLVASLGYYVDRFKLDASAESLVLETDKDMLYYRAIRARYAADDFIVITYTPQADILAPETLKDIRALQTKLEQMERVQSINSILNVPLIDSPRVSISEVQQEVPTLMSPRTDKELARKEFTQSPLYRNLIMSEDGKTTLIQVFFKRDEKYQDLMQRRNALREKALHTPLTDEEQRRHDDLNYEFRLLNDKLLEKEQKDIARVREIVAEHKDKASIHIGGVPMVTADMMDFIASDINIFGLGVLCFLVVLLTMFFKKPRWVILPMMICIATTVGMIGFLGMTEWRVTVVSSNFISLMLIITLSLCVHLIVRYREVHSLDPEIDRKALVWETVRSKALPSFYTAITTMVAFGSLIVSGIRPIIDFGWMMVFGIGLALILTFLVFPAVMIYLKPGIAASQRDATAKVTAFFARLIENRSNTVLLSYALIVVFSISGISMLNVENRFIDYFKKTTEIYQGMLKIDRDLGGTTPMDVIIDPDKEFYEELEFLREEGLLDDSAGISGSSYWFNMFQLTTVAQIHQYLDELPETGKVLSMATTMKLFEKLNNDKELDNISLAVMHKRLPEELKSALVDPYMTQDGNQIRFDIRIHDADINLKRQELLDKIRHDLKEKFELADDQIKLSGMAVLYNNMLQSLYKSQILTLGVVFLAIMIMFIFLFRSVKLSALAIIPNMIAAGFILGLMGWLGIPLDFMTITIAAITIGIGVDDTIHYIHRFMEEFPKDRNYWATVKRCHGSIGKAMYYTSVTITLGFSILVLSNFIPTIYFGILTGVAMIAALLANFTLLPLLLVNFKPLKA